MSIGQCNAGIGQCYAGIGHCPMQALDSVTGTVQCLHILDSVLQACGHCPMPV